MGNRDCRWRTEAEIEFVKGLGTYNPQRAGTVRTRQQWLGKYLAAMRWRVEWGEIDCEAVERAVRGEMLGEEAGEGLACR